MFVVAAELGDNSIESVTLEAMVPLERTLLSGIVAACAGRNGFNVDLPTGEVWNVQHEKLAKILHNKALNLAKIDPEKLADIIVDMVDLMAPLIRWTRDKERSFREWGVSGSAGAELISRVTATLNGVLGVPEKEIMAAYRVLLDRKQI